MAKNLRVEGFLEKNWHSN